MNAAPSLVSSQANRIDGLDLLRLVAVIAVMLFHFAFRGAAADGLSDVSVPALVPLAKYGHFGVCAFFVISGFVIMRSAQQRSALEFAIARFSRIYPAFVFCMTVTALATFAIGMPPFSVTAGQWFANLFIAPQIFRQPFMDGAYWSIVYEIVFYVWVALLLVAGVLHRRLDAIVMVWIAITLANMQLQSNAVERLFLTDQSGFFIAGIMLHEFWRGRRDAAVFGLLAVATMIAVAQGLSGTVWLQDHYRTPFDATVVVLVVVGSIAAVALAAGIRRTFLPHTLVVALGGLTYPLYLLHQNIGYMILNRLHGVLPNRILVEATIAGLIAAAWIVWIFVDKPGQAFVRRHLGRAGAQFLAASERRAVAR